MTTEHTPTFAELPLPATIQQTLKKIGYEQPSPIQAQSIPLILEGHDLLGTAQTGTGKTAAFALPLLAKIDLKKNSPQVLVLTPTRELAIQVAEAFKTYASNMQGFHILPIYGGQGMNTQLNQLRRGVHIVVGTPGRIQDHLRRKTLKLDQLKTVVLDEADEMLRMGFIDDVTWILEHTPEQRQVALFSATMPKPIRRIADNYLKSPKEVKIKSKTNTVERIKQLFWTISGINKLDALTRILEVEEFDGIILFVRTKTQTIELADKLEARGHRASAINGDMTQKLREHTISQLKEGTIDILVATDVAARGIDVSRISHVINYDIPYDTESYIHRIGRTGRAGRDGKAILFVAPRERRLLHAIERATKQKITPLKLPTREQINQHRIERFKAEITEALTSNQLTFFHNLIQEYIAENNTCPEKLASALAFLAQKQNPLQSKELPREEKTRTTAFDNNKPKNKKDHKKPEKSAHKEAIANIKMETFRLAVGLKHNVKPGDIVGAIANEAGLDSIYIGEINLEEAHSTVSLPADMPDEIFRHLKKVYIRNQPLQIERTTKPSKKHKKRSNHREKEKLPN